MDLIQKIILLSVFNKTEKKKFQPHHNVESVHFWISVSSFMIWRKNVYLIMEIYQLLEGQWNSFCKP
jgi:hypothetical protein